MGASWFWLYFGLMLMLSADMSMSGVARQLEEQDIKLWKDLAFTLKGYEKAIFAYWEHRHTNALLEGLNLVIQLIKTRARGFWNMQYFSTMIFLTCDKLGLERLCFYP